MRPRKSDGRRSRSTTAFGCHLHALGSGLAVDPPRMHLRRPRLQPPSLPSFERSAIGKPRSQQLDGLHSADITHIGGPHVEDTIDFVALANVPGDRLCDLLSTKLELPGIKAALGRLEVVMKDWRGSRSSPLTRRKNGLLGTIKTPTQKTSEAKNIVIID